MSRLSSLSIRELQRLLRHKKRHVGTLERKRAKLQAKIDALDDELNGTAGRRTRGSLARNDTPLAAALAATLKGRALSVTDVAAAVVKDGYRTSSPNFRTMVNAQLLNRKLFKRVGRGVYTARGKRGPKPKTENQEKK